MSTNYTDLAYQVARRVVEEGKAATTIAAELFPEQYSKKSTQASAIMLIKHALSVARKQGWLKLLPPADTSLQSSLNQIYPSVQFSVVRDITEFDDPHPANPVCMTAAKQIVSEIHRLIETKRQGDIVIANSGGPTLSTVVRFLQDEATIPEDEAHRLLFVSLNAGRAATKYHLSANFLAVRLSEIYGARHIAVLGKWPAEVGLSYHQAIKKIDLLICGAGGPDGLLSQHCGQPLPPDVVGDIALIPIDQYGGQVALSPDLAESIRLELRPNPSYVDLQYLARQNRVLMILARPAPAISTPGLPAVPAAPGSIAAKIDVAHAIFSRGLVSHCVLGTMISQKLVSQYGRELMNQ